MQIRHLLGIQLASLFGLSLFSSYKLPDFKEASWDTVLFLTPIGIIKNHLDKNPVMKSFYSDYAKGQVEISLMKAILMTLLVLLLIGVFIKIIKNLRQLSKQKEI